MRARGAPTDALARESTEASTVVARSENRCARGCGGDARARGAVDGSSGIQQKAAGRSPEALRRAPLDARTDPWAT